MEVQTQTLATCTTIVELAMEWHRLQLTSFLSSAQSRSQTKNRQHTLFQCTFQRAKRVNGSANANAGHLYDDCRTRYGVAPLAAYVISLERSIKVADKEQTAHTLPMHIPASKACEWKCKRKCWPLVR